MKGLRIALNTMQHVNIQNLPSGGRRSSPKFRETLAYSEDFKGLPEHVTQFDLLKLVKRAGREIGMSDRMTQLLEYYVLFTREQDWKPGSRPIVYQSLYKTALDFGVGERQIQKLEQALFEVGALTWNDSGNHKRFGARDAETGQILYAYGVDLSPLAGLYGLLQQKLLDKQIRDAAWMEAKRQISWHRARIRALITELSDEHQPEARRSYEEIAFSIRAYMPLEELRDITRRHESLHQDIEQRLKAHQPVEETVNTPSIYTPTDASLGAHIYSTNNSQSDKSEQSSHKDISFQESVAEGSSPSSQTEAQLKTQKAEEDREIADLLAKITWKQVLNAASDRFRDHIPLHTRPLEWRDLVEAAHALLPELGIHKSAWWEACQVLGRNGAAICIMIIDQKAQSPDQSVRNPGGYLREMTARAKKGELNLHRSVFGLLRRGHQPLEG